MNISKQGVHNSMLELDPTDLDLIEDELAGEVHHHWLVGEGDAEIKEMERINRERNPVSEVTDSALKLASAEELGSKIAIFLAQELLDPIHLAFIEGLEERLGGEFKRIDEAGGEL